MVRLATSVLVASLLAIPALAAFSEQFERSVAESDLYGRDFVDIEDNLVTRELLDELFGREFTDDIEERSPFGLGFLFKGIKAAVKIGEKAHSAHSHASHLQNNNNNNNRHHRREFDDEEFDLREFDEDLEAREPSKFSAAFKVAKTLARKGKKVHHKVGGFSQFIPQNNNDDQNQRREFDEEFDLREFDEDLEAREPSRFSAAFKVAKTLARKGKKVHHKVGGFSQFIPQNNNDDQNQRREFDEEFDLREFDEDMEAREPGFGSLFKIAGKLGGKLAHKGGKHHHHHHHHKSQALAESMPQQNSDPSQQPQRREFDEDMEAREPGFGSLFKIAGKLGGKLAHKGGKHHHHHHKSQALAASMPQQNNDPSQQPQRREFDEEVFERDFDLEDILEREYFDELD